MFPDPHYMYVSPRIDVSRILEILKRYNRHAQPLNPTDVYSGEDLEDAPDLILRMNDDILISSGLPEKSYIEGSEMADHHPVGVFSIHGFPDIHKQSIYTWDVAPLIYALLDIPIPHDTDSDLELLEELKLPLRKDNIKGKWLIARKLNKLRGSF